MHVRLCSLLCIAILVSPTSAAVAEPLVRNCPPGEECCTLPKFIDNPYRYIEQCWPDVSAPGAD